MSEKKIIKLDETVYNICNKYPEAKNIMNELGFKDITKSGMLNSAGRFMTIRKGSQMKKINLEQIVSKFESYGFSVE